MKTVYKYLINLDNGDVQTIKTKRNAVPIHFGLDTRSMLLALWLFVDPDESDGEIKIRITGTGHTIDDDIINYIGSVQPAYGLIFHAFQIQ